MKALWNPLLEDSLFWQLVLNARIPLGTVCAPSDALLLGPHWHVSCLKFVAGILCPLRGRGRGSQTLAALPCSRSSTICSTARATALIRRPPAWPPSAGNLSSGPSWRQNLRIAKSDGGELNISEYIPEYTGRYGNTGLREGNGSGLFC